MQKKRVTFDFETRSACDLKTAGAYKYSLDPTTRPTCLAFKVYGKPTVYFLPFEMVNRKWEKLPYDLRALWTTFLHERFEFSAHNAFFERCIYENILVSRYGWPKIPFKSYRCTAAKAAACALPRNLEGAGESLGLRVQKDKRGYAAMMATCKPTKQYNAWKKACEEVLAGKRVGVKKLALSKSKAPPMFLEYEHNPQIWDTLYTYCKIDVQAEEAVDEALPDLIPVEQEIWHLNQKINWRGLYVDVKTASKIVEIMKSEKETKLKELDKLTMGLVTSPHARKSILEFLAVDGIELPDIRAKTVDDVLKSGKLGPDMKRLLEIRKALSKTSTKKYEAFIQRAVDGFVRDITLYCGASTGRDTGTGIQPHNFPRPVIYIDPDRPYAAVEDVIECDPEMLKILYGETLSFLFSSILRNMLMAEPGHELFVADFSKVEVAVLWWLADNWPGLRVLKAGKDPYRYQAAQNTGKSYIEINDDERQLGKAQVLGCGFGMGWLKFQQTAYDMYRLQLTDEQSQEAVRNYRGANAAVPALWKAYEKAAIDAIENRGRIIHAGKCKFYVKKNFLWIELPSGRRLAYYRPRIGIKETDYGPRPTIEFLGLDKSKKRLVPERTWGGTLTENIVQAVARDCMMHPLPEIEKAGYEVKITVHDEGVCSRKKGAGTLKEFTSLLCKGFTWSKGLPLEAKGYVAQRYRK